MVDYASEYNVLER